MAAADLAAGIARRKISPVEVVDAVLARIEALERLNAYVTVDAEGARHAARAAERAVMRKSARLGPLHGVPFSVKDLVVTKGVRTTFGTPIYKDNVPTEDAPMVARLKAAGAVMIGKTNTPTFGWIGATHNLLIGATRNPWNLERTPGGSSGGAGRRVAYSDTVGYAEVVVPEVREACGKAARVFRELGCRVEEIDPGWPSPFAAWRAIFAGGIATRLAPYAGERDKIDAGLLRIVDEALKSPPTAFVQAFFDRHAWLAHPRRLFESYDLLLTPTLAPPAFAVGLDNATEIAGRPVPEWAWSPFTYPFNLTGQPAASVPCGFTKGGLPIGLQVVGRRFDDATVLRASAAFEAARPWAQNRPPLP